MILVQKQSIFHEHFQIQKNLDSLAEFEKMEHLEI